MLLHCSSTQDGPPGRVNVSLIMLNPDKPEVKAASPLGQPGKPIPQQHVQHRQQGPYPGFEVLGVLNLSLPEEDSKDFVRGKRFKLEAI